MYRISRLSPLLMATSFAFLLSTLVCPTSALAQAAYGPLDPMHQVTVQDDQFTYDGRTVLLRLYLPDTVEPSPVLLLSHGLGGTRGGCQYLGQHWAGRGYLVVAMQHAGSDFEVLRNTTRLNRMQAIKKAASATQAAARYSDVKHTIDFLTQQNQPEGRYANRLDLSKIGMSGHSFGAVTTQAVSGQNYSFMGKMHTDSRIKAAFAMSPSPPTVGSNVGPFRKVSIPWLLMTGTKDTSPIGRNADAASRRQVFQGLPASGHFYELVLHDATHSALGDSTRSRSERNPNHHKAIQSISTAFWDTYLKQDASAKEWINGSGAQNALSQKDVWQRK